MNYNTQSLSQDSNNKSTFVTLYNNYFQYEKDYFAMKDAERAAEDPLIRLERENKKLQSEKLRLEMENEYLARELVNSKIEMRKDIDLVHFYYFEIHCNV